MENVLIEWLFVKDMTFMVPLILIAVSFVTLVLFLTVAGELWKAVFNRDKA